MGWSQQDFQGVDAVNIRQPIPEEVEQITAGETQAAQQCSCDATVLWISP
jgi:hypothetical protein